MTTYIIRRLLAMIPALLGITVITFVLMHLTKGGPFDTEKSDPQVKAALMHAYRLDEPMWPTFMGSNTRLLQTIILIVGVVLFAIALFIGFRKIAENTILRPTFVLTGLLLMVWYLLMVTEPPANVATKGFVPGQFLNYLGNLLHGNLGTSFTFVGRPVTDIIGSAAVNSFMVGGLAFAILIVLALPLGVLAAVKQNSWIDYIATSISLIGYSIPNFVLGVVFILITGLWLKDLTGGAFYLPIAAWHVFPRDLVLPAFVLAIRPLAVLTRLTRASMIEVLNQDYVRTAQSKGLGQRAILVRHALRNALLPVVTVMGDHLGDLVTGSLVVETLFNVPGIGQWFVQSVQSRDYGMIMGTTLFYATLVLIINLIVDVAYAVIDPRIKLGAAARS